MRAATRFQFLQSESDVPLGAPPLSLRAETEPERAKFLSANNDLFSTEIVIPITETFTKKPESLLREPRRQTEATRQAARQICWGTVFSVTLGDR